MLSSFVKGWAAFMAMIALLVVLIFGGEWFQETYGTAATLAVAGVLFVGLFLLGTYLRRSR